MIEQGHGLMDVLQSTVRDDGRIEIALDRRPLPVPRGADVLVRIEASPVNPSDVGALLAVVDPETLVLAPDGRRTTGVIPARARRIVAGRVGLDVVPGLEAAGTVVAAGSDAEAQALVGSRVALYRGENYAQYRLCPAADCLPLPDTISAVEGASAFVNPMTALSMIDRMRREGHGALVHTAAASNLGQMLIRLCREEQIPLVNVVRGEAHVARLRELGAEHVCDSTAPDFFGALSAAIARTGATIAFDAVGGGRLANSILAAMEASAVREGAFAVQYGSDLPKSVYIYGSLDMQPTALTRGYGMAWSVAGFLLFHHLKLIGPEAAAQMQQRVIDGLQTVFASSYSRTVGLADLIKPETLLACTRRATGEKLLVAPNGAID